MEKSFGRILRETKEKLVEVLNQSGLPIDVMDMLLSELKAVVHNQAQAEYEAELHKQQEQKEEKKEQE